MTGLYPNVQVGGMLTETHINMEKLQVKDAVQLPKLRNTLEQGFKIKRSLARL